MQKFINFGAIQRATRVEIVKYLGVIVVISLVLLIFASFTLKSFHDCEGAFGDTVHLNLKDHPNYKKLYHGKCIKEYHGTEDHKFPFIARFVLVNETEKVIFCSGSLISGKFLRNSKFFRDERIYQMLYDVVYYFFLSLSLVRNKKFR